VNDEGSFCRINIGGGNKILAAGHREIAMTSALTHYPSRIAWQCALIALLALLVVFPAYAEDTAPSKSSEATSPSPNARKIDPDKIFGAIVKIETHSVPDARSAESLGESREGTGVVIGKDGLILTIGYLIVEASDVQVTDAKGHEYPANVVAYDQATGLGLVRTAVPLDATPIAFGDSAKVAEREPVLILNAADGASFAWVVSKRSFTGDWEYHLDSALFTSPPTTDWSGAALINRDGKLVGVGSLIVSKATDGELNLPGNVFGPIDVLKPVLADLVRQGHRAGPARPWLGVTAEELQGHLFVTKVSPDGPADQAGIAVGDIILGVGDAPVTSQDEFYRRVWAKRQAGDEVPLKVLKGVEVKVVRVRSMDHLAYFRPHATI
jgi:S1-C subfamily serine protease